MPEISREVVALLAYLLPGFLAAWLFYSLTSHAKPSQAERVIQALIFTLLINAVVAAERMLLLYLGTHMTVLRAWDKEAELFASVITALLFGFAAAYLTNKDTLHAHLRRFGVSQRSALPNEWCTVFAPREQFVVVHFKDDRRLYGWPKVWPCDPEKGHLFVTMPSWIHGEQPMELPDTEGILVSVKDISHVEFTQSPEVRK